MRWLIGGLAGLVPVSLLAGLMFATYSATSFPGREEKRARDEAEQLRARLASFKDVNLTPLMTFAEIRNTLRAPEVKAVPSLDEKTPDLVVPLSVRNQAVAKFHEGTIELAFYSPECGPAGNVATCASASPSQISIKSPFPGALFGVHPGEPLDQAVRKLREQYPRVEMLEPRCWALYRFTSDDEPSWVVSLMSNAVLVFTNRYEISSSLVGPLFVAAPPAPTRFC